jgi:D-aminoacyl-tRNA deacylase
MVKIDYHKKFKKVIKHIKDSQLKEKIKKQIEKIIQSTSLKKTLCVHTPGNWGKANIGGRDFTLPPSDASILKTAYLELKKQNNLDYETSAEVTHHGPFLSRPSLFIEIGSSKLQWEDKAAAEVIAKTIINLVRKPNLNKFRTAIAIGGGHYMPSFNKVLEKTDIALAYICPRHNIDSLNEEILQQAIKNSLEPIDFFLLDWKGLGPHKEKITKLLAKFNFPVKRVKEVLKNKI